MKRLDEQYKHYVGIDEAGRGCVGGSMFFVGVKLKPGVDISAIAFADDSKKLSTAKRAEFYEALKSLIDCEIVRKTAKDIDVLSLAHCLKTSLEALKIWAGNTPVIYDGNTNYKIEGVETLVKADAEISLVSAASIIAKHVKHLESVALQEKYPEFAFSEHNGYINKKHTEEIIMHGYTEHHRKSYKIKALQGLNLPIYPI
jgi:ribonuclease HII